MTSNTIPPESYHLKKYCYVLYANGRQETLPPESFSLLSADTTPRVYTTFRTFHHESLPDVPGLVFFDRHIYRLLSNASELDLHGIPGKNGFAYVSHATRNILRKYYEEKNSWSEDVRVRIIVSNNALEFFIDPFVPTWKEGTLIDVVGVSLERPCPVIKTTWLSAPLQARQHAEKRGAHEALLIDAKGFLREGSISNVFWFDNHDELFTVRSDVLPGITRQVLLEELPCSLVDIPYSDFLHTAKEVFITKSTSGITPVRSIDSIVFQADGTGQKIQKVIQRYKELQKESFTRL